MAYCATCLTVKAVYNTVGEKRVNIVLHIN